MQKRDYPQLNETAYWQVLPNGLTVAVVPRKGFSRKMAYFAVGTGGMHRDYTLEGSHHQAPMGIAHYLEHKLFDMPGRDISEEFAAMGAMVNAFTSYDMTAYYFVCTDHFSQCLRLLMEFVTTPYFTRETVEKEQEIIGQEIDMNRDGPETRMYETLVETMYRHHPIREPILGTRQTIAKITPQTLYDYHRAFYRPENMLLCVITDEDPQSVAQLAWEMTEKLPNPQVSLTPIPAEQEGLQRDYVAQKMEVARPIFQLGFRCDPPEAGEACIYGEFVGELASEALFGESSELYQRLYDQGLIDPSFVGGYDTLPGMAMLSICGDSDQPEKVRSAILDQAQKLAREGIPQEDFLRMKRSGMGSRLRSLDSFDTTCFRLCTYHFTGVDYFRFAQLYQAVTAQDVQQFLAKNITEDRCCLSVIQPKEDTKC